MEELFNLSNLSLFQAYLFAFIGFLLYWSLKVKVARRKVIRHGEDFDWEYFIKDHLLAFWVSLLGTIAIVMASMLSETPPTIYFLMTASVSAAAMLNSLFKL